MLINVSKKENIAKYGLLLAAYDRICVKHFLLYNVHRGIIGQNSVFLQYGHSFQYNNLRNKYYQQC